MVGGSNFSICGERGEGTQFNPRGDTVQSSWGREGSVYQPSQPVLSQELVGPARDPQLLFLLLPVVLKSKFWSLGVSSAL